jgi:hypothetical protein
VPEFAEKLVIQTDGPVLRKEFHDIWYKAIVISTTDAVEILIGKANKTGKRRHDNIFRA